MTQEIINKNTPVSPKKASFFKSLATFYTSTIESGVALTDKQNEIVALVNTFENKGKIYPKVGNLNMLDAKVVEKLTPCSPRKRALYRVLVLFFDTSLSKEIDTKVTPEHNGNYMLDTICVFFEHNVPSIIGFSILTPSLREKTEKRAEEKNKKRTYVVNVHFDAVCPVKVVASSEEEAKEIAKDLADTNDDNTDFYYTDACIADVCD